MAILASLPIVGCLCFFYSLYVLPSNRRGALVCLSRFFPGLKRYSVITSISRYDFFLLSLALGFLLVSFFTSHAGGWLNSIWYSGSVGLGLLLIAVYKQRGGFFRLAILCIGSLVLAYFFSFFGPASALNFDDDLAKYLVLPVGLIATGSLDFGPLGPQMSSASFLSAGLQALYLMGSGLEWIAHWDIAVSSILLMVWVVVLTSARENLVIRLPAVCAALLGILFITNVMYVNISAVYTPALIFAIAGGRIIASSQRSVLEALCVGSLAAIIYSFKINYILLSGAIIIGYAITVIFCNSLKRIEKIALVGITAASFYALAPNAVLKGLSILLDAVRSLFGSFGNLQGTNTQNSNILDQLDGGVGPASIVDKMLNLTPTFYGYGSDSYFSINIFVIAAFCLSMLLAFHKISREFSAPKCFSRSFPLSSLIGTLSFLILAAQFLMFSQSVGAVDANIRYMMPSVLGLVLMLGASWWLGSPGEMASLHRALICLLLAFLGSQVPSAGHRVYQAFKFGNVLAFPASREPFMAQHTRFVLSGGGADFLSNFQNLTPEGSTILVAVGFPSVIDFRRNRILLAEADGDLSQFADPEEFLDAYSVDFILWQTRGLGVRTIDQWRAWGDTSPSRANHAKRSIEFLKEMSSLAQRCESFSPMEEMIIIQVAKCLPART